MVGRVFLTFNSANRLHLLGLPVFGLEFGGRQRNTLPDWNIGRQWHGERVGEHPNRQQMTYLLCTLTFIFGFFLAAALAAGKNADNN